MRNFFPDTRASLPVVTMLRSILSIYALFIHNTILFPHSSVFLVGLSPSAILEDNVFLSEFSAATDRSLF
jgi:hypothetical protein